MSTPATLDHLKRVTENTKVYIDSDKTLSFKGYRHVGNKWNFYNTSTPTDETVPVASIDVPVEYVLDQVKTVLVPNFAYSAENYPGAPDPSMDGKPVFVLAVKGDDETITYSFLNMETLVDVVTGKETTSANTTVSDANEISVDVKLSEVEGNIITIKDDGLFASVEEVDITGKADKLVNPAEGNAVIKAGQIFVDDGNGNLAASGVTIAELTSTINDDIMSNFDTISEEDKAEIDSWF